MSRNTSDTSSHQPDSLRDRLRPKLQHLGRALHVLATKASRRATVWVFLTMVVWTATQWIFAPAVGLAPDSDAWNSLFVLTHSTASNWWTWITAIFAHAGPTHFVINSIALLSVGLSVEYSLSKRKFLSVFVGGALIAEAVQLGRLALAPTTPSIALLGASGGIAALAGALALYQPSSRFYVLYVFPVRTLYVVLTFLAVSTTLSALDPTYGGFAHAGHAAGAAAGLAVALVDTRRSSTE